MLLNSTLLTAVQCLSDNSILFKLNRDNRGKKWQSTHFRAFFLIKPYFWIHQGVCVCVALPCWISRVCLLTCQVVDMQSVACVSRPECPLWYNQYRPQLLFTVVQQVRLNMRQRELRCIDLSSAASLWTAEIINLAGTDTGSDNRVSLRG